MPKSRGAAQGPVGSLLGGIKKLKIDDQDDLTGTRLLDAFTHKWVGTSGSSLGHHDKMGKRGGTVVLYSDLNLSEDRVACGLSNGDIILVDAVKPVLPNLEKRGRKGSPSVFRKHDGLTGLRCSKANPELVYSCSGKDGTVRLWDFRIAGGANVNVEDGEGKGSKPCQIFSIGSSKIGSEESSGDQVMRPVLSLDVSLGDQLVCAGTELVGEDSFVLFWDARMVGGERGKLLGAYWESHSDDVTAVRFHPEKFNFLVTGSTDGLLNIFNLLEPSEDDALLYSLNTESSVENITWSATTGKALPKSCITCVTHCNQGQIWDAETGDQFVIFDRPAFAKAMKRSNPEAVYVNRCYDVVLEKQETLGFLASSLKGSCTRFIGVNGKELTSDGLFQNQNAIVQTAEYMKSSNRWLTFDEEGIVRSWELDDSDEVTKSQSSSHKRRKISD